MIYTTHYNSTLGDILLAAKDDALVGIWISKQKYFLGSLKEPMMEQNDHPVFVKARNWLDRYFAGEKPKSSELKLAPMGSEFRKACGKFFVKSPTES
jgi:Methylated DNA-protein cysteine methyltransferase